MIKNINDLKGARWSFFQAVEEMENVPGNVFIQHLLYR